jgi:hypothetical protein
MRTLFIGSSHLAPFKLAAENFLYESSFVGFSAQPDFGFDKFSVSVDGDLVVPKEFIGRLYKSVDLRSKPNISLDEYKLIILVGLFNPPNPWMLLNGVTFEVYKEVMNNLYSAELNTAKRIIANFKRIKNSDRKILFIPLPHIRDNVDIVRNMPPVDWIGLLESEKDDLINTANEYFLKFFSEFGVSVLLPPKSLISDGNLCPFKYSLGGLGSENFDNADDPAWGDADLTHKNLEYGLLYVDEIMKASNLIGISNISNEIQISLKLLKTIHGTYLAYDQVNDKLFHSAKPEFSDTLKKVCIKKYGDFVKIQFFDEISGFQDLLISPGEFYLTAKCKGDSISYFGYEKIDNYFVIKNMHYYLCAEQNGGIIMNRLSVGTWEKFFEKT